MKLTTVVARELARALANRGSGSVTEIFITVEAPSRDTVTSRATFAADRLAIFAVCSAWSTIVVLVATPTTRLSRASPSVSEPIEVVAA